MEYILTIILCMIGAVVALLILLIGIGVTIKLIKHWKSIE